MDLLRSILSRWFGFQVEQFRMGFLEMSAKVVFPPHGSLTILAYKQLKVEIERARVIPMAFESLWATFGECTLAVHLQSLILRKRCHCNPSRRLGNRRCRQPAQDLNWNP